MSFRYQQVLDLQQDLAKRGVVLVVARASSVTGRKDMDRLGLTTAIGADRIYRSRHDCLAAYRAANPGKGPEL